MVRYSPREWPLVSCDACGFVYLRRVPDYAALQEDHAWEKSHRAENERRAVRLDGRFDILTRWRLGLGKLIDNFGQNRAIAKTGNVLDVGSGGSCRIPEGPRPFGIEISQELARQGRAAFEARGGELYEGPATEGLEAFEGVQFDAILMRSYLEHEKSPREVLEKSFLRLKPGGQIYLRLPNYNTPNRFVMGRRWCGFRFPDHVNYFTERSLRRLAEDIGFRYRRMNRLSLFDDNLIVILVKPGG